MSTDRRRRVARAVRRIGLVFASLLLLAGCSSQGLYGVSLPGGSGGGGYRVTIQFADVLDLVPQSAVKVNDVTVGSVRTITLKGWHAAVVVQVDRDVALPANAVASIRQTSLLGEKFVDLSAPTDRPATGRLADGATIPLSRTSRNAEAEEVLGAMSLLLNGGSLEKLRTINDEVGKIFAGKESDVRDTLHQLDTFIGGLDDQKKDIVRAIDALDKFSAEVARQRVTVAKAVDALDPGLKVLNGQRQQLVDMLAALGKLGRVGTRVVQESRADLLANLRSLQPILTQLVRSGDNLPKSLDQLLTYPFPPNVTGAIVGDYVNLRLTLDLNVGDLLTNLLTSTPTGDQNGKVKNQNGPVRDPNGPATGPTDAHGKSLPPGEANPRQGDLLSMLVGGLTG
ncbi:MCE family protein [Actinocatenispora rupis]|uniref:ABC transporter substrate-binding protein n=1 Tax=Actinocatenispora rupis TaxID=519421 RepID=A0A8J3N9Q7_9ACTN|nr:MCE family protein [Actinocatenispora rupis]GID11569.1 ABC transporter substrate-binding protein [Actinocatenispora rupis]